MSSRCGFISHLIGRETINIPEIFSGVHGFTGKTVNVSLLEEWKCFTVINFYLKCERSERMSRNPNWSEYLNHLL